MGAHFQRGRALFALSRFDEANKCYREELAEHPDSALVHALMSAALVNLHRIHEADQSIRRAIELDPTCAYAHYIKSYVRQRQGLTVAAERAIEEAIRLDISPGYLSRWAEFSFQRRHYNECLKRTDESLALDPSNPDALLLRAKALAAMGRLPEAKEVAHQVLKIDPMSPAAHHQLGSFNLRGGSTSQALGPLLEARRLNPLSYNDRHALAGTYGRLLWPFRVIDSHLLRFGSWPPVRRWLFLSTISTALLIIAYLPLPSTRLAMPAFLLTFNILALPLSNDLLSIAFGKFVFRKDLDLAWYQVLPELIRVAFPIVIHALISAVAFVAAGNPYIATFTLALIPNFELLVKLVRDRDELITVLLWVLMMVGVFAPIIVAMTFLEDGFQTQYAMLCWSISLLFSFLISLHRR